MHKDIEFKMTKEENSLIDYLDLIITMHTDRLEQSIFRKPTATSTTTHEQSNHRLEHKIAAYRYTKYLYLKTKEKNRHITVNEDLNYLLAKIKL